MKEWLLTLCWYMRHGHWHVGWERWEGKPRFAMFRLWYDGWHYCLHVGPFWLEINDEADEV